MSKTPEHVPENVEPRSWCGTPTTPPCPAAAFYQLRNALIYQLAGRHPTRDQVSAAAAEVDQYLENALTGALALTRSHALVLAAK